MPLDLSAASIANLQPQMAQVGQPSAISPEHGIGAGPYAAMVGGNAADLASTIYAIQSGRGAEGNPTLKHLGLPGIAAAKVGGTVLTALLMKRLAVDHPTIAKALGYIEGGAYGLVAAHNLSVVNR